MSRQPQSFVSKWTQAFRDSEIPEPTARAVGYALATFANADGTSIRPGIARLMVAASLSRRSVIKGQGLLLRWCWIEQVNPGTPERAAEYRLTLPRDVQAWVSYGADMVAAHREDKRQADAGWTDTRRDKRHGLRP